MEDPSTVAPSGEPEGLLAQGAMRTERDASIKSMASGGHITAAVATFEAERLRIINRQYLMVSRAAAAFFAMAVVLDSLGLVLGYSWLGWMCYSLAKFAASCCVVLTTSTLKDNEHADEIHRRYPKGTLCAMFCALLVLAMACLAHADARTGGVIMALGLANLLLLLCFNYGCLATAGLSVLCWLHMMILVPLEAALFCLRVFLGFFVRGSGASGRAFAAPALVSAASMLVLLVLWLPALGRVASGRPPPRHIATYNAVFVALLGCTTTCIAAVDVGQAPADVACWQFLAGLCYLAPAVLMLCVGPMGVFRLFALRLSQRRAQQDGAFIAGLLAERAELGESFWLHRSREDARFPAEDPRRHFQEGTVQRVHEAGFDVRLPSGRTVTHSAPNHRTPWEELVPIARSQLRAIDWPVITLQLMQASSGSLDSYALSRPVDAGSFVDAMMSHSWHDEADLKMGALATFAKSFLGRRGRWPSFWLDKACIDQANIGDGLRVLPVNVMSCRQMVVLLGRTYLCRLWCVWELFTLLAFLDVEQAAQRIAVLPLEPPESGCGLEQLARYDLASSKCYDPNEEAKILRVIDSFGSDRFAARIRTLGGALERQAEGRHLAKGRSMGSKAFASMRTLTLSSIPSLSKQYSMRSDAGGPGPRAKLKAVQVQETAFLDAGTAPKGYRDEARAVDEFPEAALYIDFECTL